MKKDEAQLLATKFLKLFLEVRRDFPQTKLDYKNDNGYNYTIYFIGNKAAGNDYELNMWKTVPILECELRQFSERHPVTPNEYYLDLKLNFRGHNSSDDYKMDEATFRGEVTKAFKNAIKDFLINEI